MEVREDIKGLQAALNRFAVWMRLKPLKVDGVLGTKTWNFLRQVIAGFVPEAATDFFVNYPSKELFAAQPSFVWLISEQLNNRADELHTDTTSIVPAQRAALSNAIVAMNFIIGAAGGLAQAIPDRVVAGGSGVPLWAWALGAVGAASVAGGLVVRSRGGR